LRGRLDLPGRLARQIDDPCHAPAPKPAEGEFQAGARFPESGRGLEQSDSATGEGILHLTGDPFLSRTRGYKRRVKRKLPKEVEVGAPAFDKSVDPVELREEETGSAFLQ
jgi:hypothetical protein